MKLVPFRLSVNYRGRHKRSREFGSSNGASLEMNRADDSNDSYNQDIIPSDTISKKGADVGYREGRGGGRP